MASTLHTIIFSLSILLMGSLSAATLPQAEQDLRIRHTQVELLRDSTRALTLDQVLTSSEWGRATSQARLTLGYDPSAHWLRVPLRSPFSDPHQWSLTLDSTRWEEIDWYVLREDGTRQHHQAGTARRGPPGVLPGLRQPNILLSLASGEQVTLYLRVQTAARGSLELLAQPLSSKGFITSGSPLLLYFGATGIICLLGFLLFLYERRWGSLAITASIACACLHYAGLSGFGQYVGLPGAHFLAMKGGNFVAELGILFSLFYIQSYFRLRETQPRSQRLWSALLLVTLISLPLSLWCPFFFFALFLQLHALFHSLICFFIAIIALRQGCIFARFYLASWPIVWLTFIFDHLATQNLLAPSLIQYQFPLVSAGLVTSYLFLFLFLADRHRALIKAHEESRDALLQSVQELNLSLEEKIRARTRKLEEAKVTAEKANKSKDLFLANISHEIRTPVSALIGLSQYLIRKGRERGLPDELLRLVNQIHSGGSHLDLMLTNLLEIGVLEHGHTTPRIVLVDLPAWSQSLRDILEPIAAGQSVSLQWQDQLSSELFQSDPVRLSQILLNLAHNAIKFSSPQSSVDIDIGFHDDTLHISVRDHGRGLPDGDPSKLFEAFTRNETHSSDNQHGTGLGLHIVKTNLQLLQGHITASNHSDGGALFQVTIPTNNALSL